MGKLDMFKIIKDTAEDETRISVSYDEVRVHASVGVQNTTMYYTPKGARKFAKALRKAAKAVERG